MSISELSHSSSLNILVNNITCNELNANDVVHDNLSITGNLGVGGDTALSGGIEMVYGPVIGNQSAGTEYSLPTVAGNVGEILTMSAANVATWVPGGPDAGVTSITSPNGTLNPVVAGTVATIDLVTHAGVTGSWTNANITVDAHGIITAAANGTGSVETITGTANEILVTTLGSTSTISFPTGGVTYNQDITVANAAAPSITLNNTGQVQIVPAVANGQSATLNLDSLVITDETLATVTPYCEVTAGYISASDGEVMPLVSSILPGEISITDSAVSANEVTMTPTTITITDNVTNTTTVTKNSISTGGLTLNAGAAGQFTMPTTIGSVSQVIGVTVGGGTTLEWITVESPEATVNSVTSGDTGSNSTILVDNTNAENPKVSWPSAGVVYNANIETIVGDNSNTLTPSQLEVLNIATNSHSIVSSSSMAVVSPVSSPSDTNFDTVIVTSEDIKVTSMVLGFTQTYVDINQSGIVISDGGVTQTTITPNGITLPAMTNPFPVNGTSGYVLSTNGAGELSWIPDASGTTTTVLGTTDQIVVNTVGSTATVSLDPDIVIDGSFRLTSTLNDMSIYSSDGITLYEDSTSPGTRTTITNTTVQIDNPSSTAIFSATGIVLPSMTNPFPSTGATNGQVLAINTATNNLYYEDNGLGGVETVSGTVNQINVNNTDPQNPVIGFGNAGLEYNDVFLFDNGINDTVLISPIGGIAIQSQTPSAYGSQMDATTFSSGYGDYLVSMGVTSNTASISVSNTSTSVATISNQYNIQDNLGNNFSAFPTSVALTDSGTNYTNITSTAVEVVSGANTTTLSANGISLPTMDNPFPVGTETTGQVLAINTATNSVYWANDGTGSLSSVVGTAQEVTVSTVDGVATVSLPTLVSLNDSKISVSNGTTLLGIELDATLATPQIIMGDVGFNNASTITNAIIKTRTPSYSATMIPTSLVIAGGGNTTTISTTNIGITDGARTFGINGAGAITANSTVGTSGQVLTSQGSSLFPAIWANVSETESVNCPFQFSGTGAAIYTPLLVLNRNQNTVCAKFQLTTATLQNAVGFGSNKIIGLANVSSQYLPTYAQTVGKINICYLSGPLSSDFSIWGTCSLTVRNVSGQLQLYCATDPTGPETGAQYINNAQYITFGNTWIGVADFTGTYYTFTYQLN